MSNAIHPAAPHNLPVFITAPGQTDAFLVGAAIFLILAFIAVGTLYFRLHSLPEKLAHGRASQIQFELVAVLALLALFTHQTVFWIAALILAFVPVPDFHAPLAGMAESLAKMAGWSRDRGPVEPPPPEPIAPPKHSTPSEAPVQVAMRDAEAGPSTPRPEKVPDQFETVSGER